MEEEFIIARVFENKCNGQKIITIPKRFKVKKGDYVKVQKLK